MLKEYKKRLWLEFGHDLVDFDASDIHLVQIFSPIIGIKYFHIITVRRSGRGQIVSVFIIDARCIRMMPIGLYLARPGHR